MSHTTFTPPPSSPATSRDVRIVEALQAYRVAADAGEPIDRGELLRRYDDVADELAGCLDNLDFIENIAPQLQPGDSSVRRPASLGDFRIIRELGRGGMGVVYEAEQLSLERRVALKVLPYAAMLDESQLKRFKNEARAAATLKHDNIVSVHSVGTDRGVHYYAMELIEGMSLAEVIAQLRAESPESRGREEFVNRDAPVSIPPGRADRVPCQQPLPHSPFDTDVAAALSTQRSTNPKQYFDSIAQLGIQAARALDHAHQQGIVHRDIKPGNLMLDANGKLLITDFGLARIGSTESMTMTGDLIGTLRYMSPEQARGDRTIDHRSDVYSLGITLYELATGKYAFTSTDRQQLLQRIAGAEVKPPRRLRPNVPRELETIILKAIAKQPDDRFATAQDLADDLHRCTQQLPITAKRQTRLSKVRHWVRRNRTVAALGAIALLLLLTLAIAGPIAAMRQQSLAQQANAEAAHSRRLRYFADMRSAFEAWHRRDYRQALRLLDENKPSLADPDLRHFEWHFLWNQLHFHEKADGLVHADNVQQFALSNDKRKLATVCSDGRFYVWDLATRKLISSNNRPPTEAWVKAIAVTNDGSKVVLGLAEGAIHVLDAKSGETIASFGQHEKYARDVVLTPDERLVVSGDADGKLYLWDIETGARRRAFEGHRRAVSAIRFAPDDEIFATSGWDCTVKVWSVDQATPRRVLSGTNFLMEDCAFVDDGAAICGGGADRSLWKWDLATGVGQPLLPNRFVPTPVEGIAYSAKADALAVHSHYQGVTVLRASSGVPYDDVHSLPVFRRRLSSRDVEFAFDGTTLVFFHGREVKFCDLAALRDRPDYDVNPIEWWPSLQFLPDHDVMVVCGAGDSETNIQGRVQWWSLGKQNAINISHENLAPAWDIARSTRGDLLAVAHGARADGPRGTISLFDVQSGELKSSIDDMDAEYRSVAFSPDGSLLAAGTYEQDSDIVVWDLESKSVKHRFHIPTTNAMIMSLAFSRDGQQLIAGGGRWMDGEICVWDLAANKLTSRLADVGLLVMEVAIAPDEREMAFVTLDGSVQLWTLPQQKRRLFIEGAGEGFGVAYSPDGLRLATGGGSRGVRLWDVPTGRQVASLQTHIQVGEVTFFENGRAIAAALQNGDVVLWREDGTISLLHQ